MDFIGKRYNDYNSFIKLHFGERVQKISLDVGFSCPNRDGSKGYGGCTYCNNNTFNPDYCEPQKSIVAQLQEGIEFFAKRGKNKKFLAYFQAYTNTYSDLESLKAMYQEALSVPNVVGLVIGTRPDCISDEVIAYLEELSKDYFISLDFGVESTNEKTLLDINRCHTFSDTIATFEKCKDKGFHLGAHIIMGLPGESKNDLMQHAVKLSKLPIDTLKIHHLQIVRNSVMAVQYKRNPENFNLFTLETYINFVTDFIGYLRPDIVIERFISEAPKELLVAPKWGGIRKQEILDRIDQKLKAKDTWQGKYYKPEKVICLGS
ncbi:TIGR01212 family radical SAM protein [Maribacter sp. TH_r10]|uniref:TIGR01212 family radical SAM protein n=1 Tax=Maribacter sp. TH_r10 TaxID=3082086 RepID=UPI0029534A55|nr:TIGR01212 family radical SAM protein [Maribacter sp. TH_r10]MDV7137906.1 TIGR01212 family radical SAM protein [Maribacter sp. TH_r10]